MTRTRTTDERERLYALAAAVMVGARIATIPVPGGRLDILHPADGPDGYKITYVPTPWYSPGGDVRDKGKPGSVTLAVARVMDGTRYVVKGRFNGGHGTIRAVFALVIEKLEAACEVCGLNPEIAARKVM